MSLEAVTQFLIKLGDEQGVYDGLRLAMTQRSPGVETIVDFGAGHGFRFTDSEFSAVVKGALKLDGELETNEPYALERVARMRKQRAKVHPMD
tara:strand:- start:87 stop:365 length:279 start_codon:yes stop_codon:yes gene_type:complete